MPSVHLPQPPFPQLRVVPPISLGREDVLWGCRVHCPYEGCRWYDAAWDATDALFKLEQHYGTHDAERAALARRVDEGGVPA